MAKTLVGIFDELKPARSAQAEIQQLGIPNEYIRLVNSSSLASWATDQNIGSELTWMDKLRNWFAGVSEDEDRKLPELYSEAVRRGHHVLVVDVDDAYVDRIVAIMQKHGTVDIDVRAAQWQAQGYKGFDRTAAPYTTEQRAKEMAQYQAQKGAETTAYPVVQEEVAIGKRTVARGGVRVHSYVSERPVQEVVRLREERINVQRRPADWPARTEDLGFKEGTIDVSAVGEEAVVQKSARVVEEVLVNKQVEQRDETVKENVRRKDVKVEKVPPQAPPPQRR